MCLHATILTISPYPLEIHSHSNSPGVSALPLVLAQHDHFPPVRHCRNQLLSTDIITVTIFRQYFRDQWFFFKKNIFS